MNYEKTLSREKRMKELIEMECTGTPEQLAVKLSCSPSTVFRMLRAFKELGEPIYYSDIKQSYYYKS